MSKHPQPLFSTWTHTHCVSRAHILLTSLPRSALLAHCASISMRVFYSSDTPSSFPSLALSYVAGHCVLHHCFFKNVKSKKKKKVVCRVKTALLHHRCWTTGNKLLTASQGHLQASAIFLTFSQGLCEIFMTALICCVAMAVAGGAGANAVSIPHANATHLTNRASAQTTARPSIPPPLPQTFVLLTANYSNHCGALSAGGQGDVPAFLKVKQLSGLSTSMLRRRRRERALFDRALYMKPRGPTTAGDTSETKLTYLAQGHPRWRCCRSPGSEHKLLQDERCRFKCGASC